MMYLLLRSALIIYNLNTYRHYYEYSFTFCINYNMKFILYLELLLNNLTTWLLICFISILVDVGNKVIVKSNHVSYKILFDCYKYLNFLAFLSSSTLFDKLLYTNNQIWEWVCRNLNLCTTLNWPKSIKFFGNDIESVTIHPQLFTLITIILSLIATCTN